METAGQTLSASLAYSASIRRRFVAGCAAVTGEVIKGEGEEDDGGMAVVGSTTKEEAEEKASRERERDR